MSNIRATHVELVLLTLDEPPVMVFLVNVEALVAQLAVDVDDKHILQSKEKTLDYNEPRRRRFEMQNNFRANTDNGILIQHHSSRKIGLPLPSMTPTTTGGTLVDPRHPQQHMAPTAARCLRE